MKKKTKKKSEKNTQLKEDNEHEYGTKEQRKETLREIENDIEDLETDKSAGDELNLEEEERDEGF